MTADRATLIALAERVEQAQGPDRLLDAEIFRAAGTPLPADFAGVPIALEWDGAARSFTARVDVMRVRYEHPAYTASLDAAVTLVPANDPSVAGQAVFWKSGHDGEGPDPSLFKATVLIVSMFASRKFDSIAETEPLARVAAALRAHAAMGGE